MLPILWITQEDEAFATRRSPRPADGPIRMASARLLASFMLGFPAFNQTPCGLQRSKSGLLHFHHIPWIDVQPATDRDADMVEEFCRRCAARMGAKRPDPRP